jgi:hypothetical protein
LQQQVQAQEQQMGQPPQQQQQQQQQLPAAGELQQDPRSIALVASDVCLKVLHKDLLPLGLSLLIQYDLPSSKVGQNTSGTAPTIFLDQGKHAR